MLKILGAALLVLCGGVLGLGGLKRLREELAFLRSMDGALGIMAAEIELCARPLPELFATLSGRCGGEGKTLAGMVTEGFSSPERASFGAIWASALTGYPRREREILLRLGDVLGRGAVEMQLPVIALCRREMELSLREAAKHRREMSRVYIGLGTAGGMMLAVLLI